MPFRGIPEGLYPESNGKWWDMDDFLMENQSVPCRFRVAGIGLGFLVNDKRGDDQEDIPEGKLVHVPWWFAYALADGYPEEPTPRSYVHIGMPSTFHEVIVRNVRADPNSNVLSKKSEHFFEIGVRIACWLEVQRSLTANPDQPVSSKENFSWAATQLMNAAVKRFRGILVMTKGETATRRRVGSKEADEGMDRHRQNLTKIEGELWELQQKHKTQLQDWTAGSSFLQLEYVTGAAGTKRRKI
mmetsp:Transcript_18832/g.45465  ORF Transcript_18832/g.45465 Transcript_18832/m.45465 type:complete len:243 (+) Transcript_18832:25-753(+)